MPALSKRLGIDLGTANSLVYMTGEGVVLNEPTVVAVSAEDNRVLAVGREAKEMLGRTPGNIVASRPLRSGVIADYAVTEAMLRYFIDRAVGRSRLFKPEVMVGVPSGATSVERRAVVEAATAAGAKTAYLIDEPLAAAIGANVPIATPAGNMVLDIGGGSTEAAVISLGGVVTHASVRVAGDKIDEAIASHARRKYDLIIGERMAEEIKIAIGSALAPAQGEGRSMEVRGRDAIAGLPKTIELTSGEINEAILPILRQIVSAVRQVLEKTPPELSSDIIERGIVMAGGTSQLANMAQFITQEIGVPAHVADDPMMCVVKGTGIALENLDLYKRGITRK
jgi:rod shape-determining protein MreB